MINLLDIGSTDLKADDYIITQYVGGGTTTTTYHRRAASHVINATLVKAALNCNTSTTTKWLNQTGAWSTPTAAEIDAATSKHTHTLTIAGDSGTNALTLAANTKYKLTAGGSTFIFTTPAHQDISGKANLSGATFTGNISLKNTTADITEADNVLSGSSSVNRIVSFIDNQGKYFARVYGRADTNGDTHLFLQAGNWYGETPAQVYGGIDICYHKSGDNAGKVTYSVTNGANFRTAIGAGTSSLTIGTTSTTAAAGNHTHTLTIAADSGTNALSFAYGTKYKITAGGSTYIFTTPSLGTTATTAAAGNHNHNSVYVNVTGDTMSGSLEVSRTTYSDGGTYIKLTSNSKTVGLHVGSGGTNRGVYDWTAGSWLCYYDSDNKAHFIGNASTATKLVAERTISLTGSVTGSGSFDGSGNLSITTTTNHSHASITHRSSLAKGSKPSSTTYLLGSWGYETGSGTAVKNRFFGFEGNVNTSGRSIMSLIAYQNTADSTAANSFSVWMDQDGTRGYSVSDAAAFRSAIGAGTSSLAIGTTSSTAAAGNHNHDSVYAKLSGATFTGQLYVNIDTDVAGTGDSGSVVIGNKAGTNVSLDSNEIMARNNKHTSTLNINIDNSTDTDHLAAVMVGNASDTHAYMNLRYTTAATSKTTGALRVGGGVGVAGDVYANAFHGPLTGNVTGNCSGSSGSCTGNAATTSKLLDSAHSWTATEVYNYMTARVLKAGDDMTGSIRQKMTNVTRGSSPSANQYRTYEWIDNGNKRVAQVEYGMLTSGESRLHLYVLGNNTTSTGDEYGGIIIYKKVGVSGNTSATYNANNGTFSATTFSGNLTGNVTGNCSGSSGSCTGNAATATCVIHPDAAVSYIAGAKGTSAALYAKKTYNADHWYPAVALETKGGGAWQIGNYNDETLEFQYATKANRDSNNNSTSEIYMQQGDKGRVVTSENYTNWTVTKTGDGASGKWSINITGHADGDLALTGGTVTGNINLQDNGVDAKQANNGVSSTHYPTTFNILDKNGLIIARQEAVVEKDGDIQSYWYVRNYKTDGTMVAQKGITMIMNKAGTMTYSVSDAANFRSAIGAGTSSLAIGTTSTTAAAGNHNHDSIYAKLSGATFTGDVWVKKASGTCYCGDHRSDTGLQVCVHINSGSTNHGIYSNGYYSGSAFTSSGLWLIYRNSTGVVTVNGNCTGSSGSCTGNAATATCATRTGVSVGWHKGRDAVVAKTTTINSYSPTISVKTTNGSWEIGSYNHNDYKDKLIFSYVTDANYNSNTNTHVDFTITTDGYFSGSCASSAACTGNAKNVTGTVAIDHGGTGKTTAAEAWTALGGGASGKHADSYFSLSNHTHTSFGNLSTDDITIKAGKGLTLTYWGGTYGTSGTCLIWYCGASATQTGYKSSTVYIGSTGNCNLLANKVYNAVWNDYAECREVEINEPGYCVTETSNGKMIKTNKRLQAGCKITSDTYGTCMGETATAKTPIAVAGRVLAYPYRSRDEYTLGVAVCSAPGGTVDIMTRNEIMMYPERIVGTVSEIPSYEIWHGGNQDGNSDINVNGRIWIYVR